MKSFLGLVNFYHRHVANLVALARPLTALTRKDYNTGCYVQFKWDSQCEEAVKKKLTTAPVLRPPDLTKEFFVLPVREDLGLC